MAELDILEYLDLQRATPVDTDSQKLSDSEAAILSEVKVNQFDVDFVYFNTDEETKNSFPAVFLKKVSRFNDNEVLKDIAETQRINPGRVERYYTPNSASEPNEELFRFIDKKVFTPPFVIMKKGQQKKQLAASYIDYFSYCTTACYIFNGNVDPGLKKALTCILNSKLTTYLLFLTAASWGIEREQVFLDEVLESPALLPLLKTSSVRSIARLFDEILSIKP